MLKGKRGPLMFVLSLAAWVCACGSGGNSGTPSSGGTSGAAGGASGSTAGSAGAGGATSGGGMSGADAGGAAGMAITTLADACAKNCSVASGLAGCSTTTDVCVQSCLTTFDNTSAINADLGRQYTAMMVCVANNPQFASPAGFICAKPDRALNKWSPGPDSVCEQLICDWNCNDGTLGDFDPFVDIRCMCSSL